MYFRSFHPFLKLIYEDFCCATIQRERETLTDRQTDMCRARYRDRQTCVEPDTETDRTETDRTETDIQTGRDSPDSNGLWAKGYTKNVLSIYIIQSWVKRTLGPF